MQGAALSRFWNEIVQRLSGSVISGDAGKSRELGVETDDMQVAVVEHQPNGGTVYDCFEKGALRLHFVLGRDLLGDIERGAQQARHFALGVNHAAIADIIGM